MSFLDNIKGPDDLKKLSGKDLKVLCSEIREFMISTISKNGGHLAPSLGVVELTTAIHYVFSSPKDKIIWDVGHQAYPHKILTGRKDRFDTIRKLGGLSGFPKASESPHDQFDVGHSSTSLSVGIGFAKARDLKKEKHEIISVIGDGAMTGGMAFEAINNIGYLNSKMIIIMNDNKMSISENVGALSKHTSRITKTRLYRQIKKEYEKLIKESKNKDEMLRFKQHLKRLTSPNFLFEKLGIEYIGPVDGHDLKELIKALKEAKKCKGPVLIHVKTIKGKGYEFAEKNATKFHGIGKFNACNGDTPKKNGRTYTKVFGETLCRLATKNKKIVAITAAMCTGTGLTEFAEKFPDRFFDVGIAEQHAVTFAAALAKQGFIPVVAIYSTFLQRAYDQIIHDVALQGLPVIFAVDRAGLVGEDGPTHHGVFDLSYLSTVPGLNVAAPKDKNELQEMLKLAVKSKRPFAIRYPRGGNEEHDINQVKKQDIGDSELLIPGNKAVIVAIGSMVKTALNVATRINSEKGRNTVGVINARFVKPLDKRIIKYCKKTGKALVLEENTVLGGLGSRISKELSGRDTIVKCIGITDQFIEHGSKDELLRIAGLDEETIYKHIKNMVL